MELPNWLKRKKKIDDEPLPLAGVAVVRYDQLKQQQYWETTNADGEDAMSLTGAANLPLDPAQLPLGTVVKIFMPGPADGE